MGKIESEQPNRHFTIDKEKKNKTKGEKNRKKQKNVELVEICN
jgi:hypothetical protein